jgi:hypothetical protein
MMHQQLDAGTPVYDVAGKRVGIVSLNNPYERYLVVQKGWLFPQDVYLPLAAIDDNASDGIYLRLHKHDLRDPRYSAPPLDGTTDEHDLEERTS